MKLLWWRHQHEERDPAAEQAAATAESQWPAVRRLAASIQAHREANHFAEMFTAAMRRKES